LAERKSTSRFSTVPFSVTLLPTTPQVTPSGLRKSFCGSVTTSAVLAGSIFMPGSGSWA
jgi:hypothetical protein